MDFLKPTPPSVTVRLESVPPGADAKTSLGPGCKTPCAVSVQGTEPFTVSYTLDKYQPQSVSVSVIQQGGDFGSGSTAITDPNPVFAELQPAAPPPRKPVHHRKRVAKPKPAAAAPAAAPADGAFPPPSR
ncbi:MULTISPECIES: hypothetical protein [unclassified Bradyrhizobium]|uniref:hypothetical protein n=1 Tax=unclassified Bradyrhizobium TaxID=2631580 RepID=UPI0032E4F9F5